jgi:peptide/nickel transport system substrate-binding protein
MDLAGYESDWTNPKTGTDFAWDPQATWDAHPFELFRCCLLRTLLSYNGHSIRGGGAELRPDLAADLPSISADGLTWTFQLKAGLRYAPPMADREIVAGDFVRALERAIRPDPFHSIDPSTTPYPSFTPYASFFFDVIAGASDFAYGSASSISGLETPDDHTLVIHLVKPTGDLGARLALPAAAPIPLGATDGHDTGYGPFLVASGPYMIEGSDQLNPTLPADQQQPVSGYVPGDHLDLVRNPSWDRAADLLRGAFVDRIEISNLADYDALMTAVQSNQIDVSLDTDLETADVSRLRADSAAASRVHVAPALQAEYIYLNLAVPPFDDIHVRRAVELATDKKTLSQLIAPGSTVQNHAVPDAFENGLLSDYDPFATPDDAGNPDAAKAEMAQSVYDSNHDGMCDSTVCQHIIVPVRNDSPDVTTAFQDFATDLVPLGIQLDLVPPGPEGAIGYGADPNNHAALTFAVGFQSDYFSATDWFELLATGAAIGSDTGFNVSLIGATSAQLTSYGYTVTSVPSLDERIATCSGMNAPDAFSCWSGVDQYLIERTAAWVPIATDQVARLTSQSVTSFDFDASLAMPALGQIEVAH